MPLLITQDILGCDQCPVAKARARAHATGPDTTLYCFAPTGCPDLPKQRPCRGQNHPEITQTTIG